MKVIKDSYTEKTIYFTLDYNNRGDGCDFSFPCDENGNVLALNDAAQENLKFCRKNAENYTVSVRKHIDRYRHGMTIQCSCNEIFELQNQYLGACECPKCGQWYNFFGQTLKNPDRWEENY